MPCLNPLKCYRSADGQKSNGKWSIVFKVSKAALPLQELYVPCGKCIWCRIERSRVWAVRCMNEASNHKENCFITLTYEKCPESASLNTEDIQKFLKRLRKKVGKVRYFQCGEYGEKLQRPHHHALIFGYGFLSDKKLFKIQNGIKIYTSEELTKLWGKGHCTVGDLTWETVAYTARYVLKKVNGLQAEEHYGGRKPEWVSMSRRPGIGKEWFDRYKSDLFPKDICVVKAKYGNYCCKPPRYYDNLYEVENPEGFKEIKERRKEKQKKPDFDRLKAKEIILNQKIKRLVRPLERTAI